MKTSDKIMRIVKHMKGDWFEEDENLVTDGYLSSYDLVKLVKEIEDSFLIKIPIETIEPEAFNSIKDICLIVEKFKGGMLDDKSNK